MSVAAGAWRTGRAGRKGTRCWFCGSRCYRPATACPCHAAACMPCRREGARPGCNHELAEIATARERGADCPCTAECGEDRAG